MCAQMWPKNPIHYFFHYRGPGAVGKSACYCIQVSKKQKCFFPAHSWRFNVEGTSWPWPCSVSDRQVTNFELCVWRAVSSHSSHHPQEVHLAQFSLRVHNGGLKPYSFYFTSLIAGKDFDHSPVSAPLYPIPVWPLIFHSNHSFTGIQ